MAWPSQKWSNDPIPDRSAADDNYDASLERERAKGDQMDAAAEEVLKKRGRSPQFEGVEVSQIDKEREARIKRNSTIHKEVQDNVLNKIATMRTEATPLEAGKIKGLVNKFKGMPAGPKKEEVRRSVHNIVQGTSASSGRVNHDRYVLPYGQEMPCANAGCENIIKYDVVPAVQDKKTGKWSTPSNVGGGDVACANGACKIAGVPNVQRPAER